MIAVWFFLIATIVLSVMFVIGLAWRRYTTGNDLSEQFDPNDKLWLIVVAAIVCWILMFIVRAFV